MKSFCVHSDFFNDEEVLSEGFADKCSEIFKELCEFVGMLNDICMPDDDGSSEEEENEGEEEDAE